MADDQVFLSYAHEDRERALKVYDYLDSAGINVWMDVKSLKPGIHWRSAISDAIEESKYFLLLLSNTCVDKRGFVQKEVAEAISILDQHPPDSIFIVPARLDDCRPRHRRLMDLHFADLFADWEGALASIVDVVGHSESKDATDADHCENSLCCAVLEVDLGYEVTAIACHPTEPFAIVGTASGRLFLYRIADQHECVSDAEGHEEPITGVAFSDAGESAVSSGLDGTVKKWRILTRSAHSSLRTICTYVPERHEDWEIECRDVAVSGAKGLVAVARGAILDNSNCQAYRGEVDSIDLLECKNLSLCYSWSLAHETECVDVRRCKFDCQGKFLIALNQCGDQIRALRLDGYEFVTKRNTDAFYYAEELAVSPTKREFAVAGSEPYVTLHRSPRGRQIDRFESEINSESPGHYVGTNCIAFHPSGSYVAAGYGGPGHKRGTGVAWRIRDREIVFKQVVSKHPVTVASFNNEGSLLLLADEEGRVTVNVFQYRTNS